MTPSHSLRLLALTTIALSLTQPCSAAESTPEKTVIERQTTETAITFTLQSPAWKSALNYCTQNRKTGATKCSGNAFILDPDGVSYLPQEPLDAYRFQQMQKLFEQQRAIQSNASKQ